MKRITWFTIECILVYGSALILGVGGLVLSFWILQGA